MASLIPRIIALLQSTSDGDRAKGANLSADLFDAARGAPWPVPAVQFEVADLQAERLGEVKLALATCARVDLATDLAGVAIWALGKSYEREFRPLYLEALSQNLVGNPGTLHQALIALDNLDEPSLLDVTSFSIDEVDSNRGLARAVLAAADAR